MVEVSRGRRTSQITTSEDDGSGTASTNRPARAWPELSETQGQVLLELLLHGSLSRVRLAERVGLSRTSLTRIARELVDLGLVTEGEVEVKATRGRPAESLDLRPEAAHFIGIKLTGDHVYAVVTDLSARVVAETSEPIADKDVAAVVAQIADAARRLAEHHPVAIGIGVAGDVTRENGRAILQRSNFLGWHEVALEQLVADATGLPTTVTNDVHALAGAHHWFGELQQHRSMVVYGLGAGIGSGVVIDDELMEGTHGRSGRVGHQRIGGAGRICDNGHTDCVHSFVTIPAIEFNSGMPYAEAVAAAKAGNTEVFEWAAYALGAAVAETVNAFDPELVAIMGEGRDMIEIAPDHLRRGLVEFLEQGYPERVKVVAPPFTFGLYARGAAVAAMRDLLA